jgi:hypothetical protein
MTVCHFDVVQPSMSQSRAIVRGDGRAPSLEEPSFVILSRVTPLYP